jgi:hypothetical protein
MASWIPMRPQRPVLDLHVGINMRTVHGGGQLTIWPGRIVLIPSKFSSRYFRDLVGDLQPVTHAKPTITIVRGRHLGSTPRSCWKTHTRPRSRRSRHGNDDAS